MYHRIIQQHISEQILKGKIIIIYGARRVGKTTLTKYLLKEIPNAKYINCELHQNKTALETTNSELLGNFIGSQRLFVFDEAQQISNIGKVLKILYDTFPDIRIIATGSSSFDLGNKLSEPLTGRSRVYHLYPFSIEELLLHDDFATISARLEKILRFGLYPEVYLSSEEEAIEEINNIASNYLYKDILQFENIRKSDLLVNLLKAIALQLGNEVSLQELGKLLGTNVHTIKRYIELLEKAFIIFRLRSFSRNLRKEIARGYKIYFQDLGIRNSLIQNFNPLSMRTDTGALWENFCIIERIKQNQNHRRFVNTYFWRTYDQKEIDYIEESGGRLNAFEFKFNPSAIVKYPGDFLETYKNSSFSIIHQENYLTEFIGISQ
ncbi:MAG: ATP-binding protein [Bacteroidales bacterium]